VFLGESDRSSHDEILCEDGGSRAGTSAGENREIEARPFFSAAGGGGEADPLEVRLPVESLRHQKHDPAHDSSPQSDVVKPASALRTAAGEVPPGTFLAASAAL